MTVINEETFAVRNAQDIVGTSASDKLGRVVRRALRNSVGKTSGGVVVAVQDVNNRVTGLLARNASPDQRSDVRVVDPWLDNGWSDGVNDNNCVVIAVGDSGNEVVRVAPERQVLAAEVMSWANVRAKMLPYRSPSLPSTVI